MPESGMPDNMHQMVANITATPHRRTFEGREHLVVPVVMARAGVTMNGAQVPESEMIPESWNGVPVTNGHPKVGESYISANSPQMLEQWAVGRIFNAEVSGGALKAEAWIDVNRADEQMVAELESGAAQMDVSTGYFSRDEQQGGITTHVDIKPDHLALLPNEAGACSWSDGCGVRANNGGFRMKVNEAMETLKQALTGVKTNCECEPSEKLVQTFGAHYNELGYGDVMEKLQRQLDAMDSPTAAHYLKEVFSDDFVYMVRPGEQASPGSEPQMFRRSYSVGEDEQVVMGDDAMEVRKVTEYQPVSNQEGQDMTDETKAKEAEQEQEQPKAEAESAEVLTNEDKAALEFARQQYNEHRNSLVQKITSNSEMTEDQLKAMDVPTLETIANGIKPAADYSARAVPTANGAEQTEEDIVAAMTPPTVNEMLKTKQSEEVH